MSSVTVGIAGITSRLARLLLASLLTNCSPVTIRGLCRNKSKLPPSILTHPQITVIEADAFDLPAVNSFVQGCDVVVCAYLGLNDLVVDGQKLLIDACEEAAVKQYFASDFTLDYNGLESGQHPTKESMKIVKEYLERPGRKMKGVYVLCGAFMEVLFSPFFGLLGVDEEGSDQVLKYWGSGEEVWEVTTYGSVAEYTAALVMDERAVGTFRFLGDRKSTRQIAEEFEVVYGKKPKMECQGSFEELFKLMHETFNKDSENWPAYVFMFYHYYCLNSKTHLGSKLNNGTYPAIKPASVKDFLHSHDMKTLSSLYDTVGLDVLNSFGGQAEERRSIFSHRSVAY
ncbi:hypothetical protein QBC44DRAFT_433 [Cladorrhinum sp. PSN332]|nr:hypothetical protein QBC44DRAFT_433 [Cladorrhinum sp. PSN332]